MEWEEDEFEAIRKIKERIALKNPEFGKIKEKVAVLEEIPVATVAPAYVSKPPTEVWNPFAVMPLDVCIYILSFLDRESIHKILLAVGIGRKLEASTKFWYMFRTKFWNDITIRTNNVELLAYIMKESYKKFNTVGTHISFCSDLPQLKYVTDFVPCKIHDNVLTKYIVVSKGPLEEYMFDNAEKRGKFGNVTLPEQKIVEQMVYDSGLAIEYDDGLSRDETVARLRPAKAFKSKPPNHEANPRYDGHGILSVLRHVMKFFKPYIANVFAIMDWAFESCVIVKGRVNNSIIMIFEAISSNDLWFWERKHSTGKSFKTGKSNKKGTPVVVMGRCIIPKGTRFFGCIHLSEREVRCFKGVSVDSSNMLFSGEHKLSYDYTYHNVVTFQQSDAMH